MNIGTLFAVLLFAAFIVGLIAGIPIGRELESAKQADKNHDRGGEEW